MTALLLVEDDPAYPLLIRAQLEHAWPEARLEHVRDLAGAVDRLHEDRIDCVLVDLGLPDGQGFGNVERMREAAPATPVIVLSGRDEDRRAEQAADAFLRKHETAPEDLVRTVRAVLTARRDEVPAPGRADASHRPR